MPTDTFSIAASGDDAMVNAADATYPPTTVDGSWFAEQTDLVTNFLDVATYRRRVAMMRFDTSSIPDSAVVWRAVLRMFITGKIIVAPTDAPYLFGEWYAFDGSVAFSDYVSTSSSTAHVGTDMALISTGADRDFELRNLGSINKTGYSGIRLHCHTVAAPTNHNQLEWSAFDHTTNTEPRLIVSHGSPETRYPGTAASLSNAGTSESAEAWVNPLNALADDGTIAAITAASYDTPDISQLLVVSNFGFTIPTDATINGIVVEMDRSNVAGAASDNRLQLAKGTTFANLVGNNKADTATDWPASLATVSYGTGTTDLWGTTWTPAEINASSFAVMMSVQADAANTDVGVDFIRVNVYYTEAAGAPGPVWRRRPAHRFLTMR